MSSSPKSKTLFLARKGWTKETWRETSILTSVVSYLVYLFSGLKPLMAEQTAAQGYLKTNLGIYTA